MLDPNEGVALITDGSADYRDRSGGWAWIALDAFDGMMKGSGYRAQSTNNQMELWAVVKGLKWVYGDCGSCDVLVYCDSEYVVLGASDRTRKRTTNHNFWNKLESALILHNTVEFIHVKGHSGHIYNEMADQLASTARRKGVQ